MYTNYFCNYSFIDYLIKNIGKVHQGKKKNNYASNNVKYIDYFSIKLILEKKYLYLQSDRYNN